MVIDCENGQVPCFFYFWSSTILLGIVIPIFETLNVTCGILVSKVPLVTYIKFCSYYTKRLVLGKF